MVYNIYSLMESACDCPNTGGWRPHVVEFQVFYWNTMTSTNKHSSLCMWITPYIVWTYQLSVTIMIHRGRPDTGTKRPAVHSSSKNCLIPSSSACSQLNGGTSDTAGPLIWGIWSRLDTFYCCPHPVMWYWCHHVDIISGSNVVDDH